jgi:7,8-dihydropterin-6-yl-methyl-4-(beta-D-ribofuranosyl)aminobenzene 5'-phosphate synthase
MKVTIVYDNEAWQPGLEAAWGFSCLVEANGQRLLFDTGGVGAILLQNMETLNLDPRSIFPNLYLPRALGPLGRTGGSAAA